MRILVFSDVHGNAIALEAMLSDVADESFDHVVCLGDALQGGPQPHEVAVRLRELGCPVVMGNADDFLLSGEESGAEQISDERRRQLAIVRDWSFSQLTQADQEMISNFSPTIEIELENGRSILCFHGSPKSFDDIIFPTTPDEEIRQFLEPIEQTFYTGGHTHVQFMRHFGRTFHFNPGSVGLAYRHDQDEANFRVDPWAEYAVLTDAQGRLSLEFRRVPFDAERLIQVYVESGRPFADIAIRQYSGG
jgi:putative phosphoesterase